MWFLLLLREKHLDGVFSGIRSANKISIMVELSLGDHQQWINIIATSAKIINFGYDAMFKILAINKKM